MGHETALVGLRSLIPHLDLALTRGGLLLECLRVSVSPLPLLLGLSGVLKSLRKGYIGIFVELLVLRLRHLVPLAAELRRLPKLAPPLR